MGYSPVRKLKTVTIKPDGCAALRLRELLGIREKSVDEKEPILVQVSLFDGLVTHQGRPHRVIRHEKFIYVRGDVTSFAFFDSSLWDTMTPQEKYLIEHGPRDEKRGPRQES